MEAEHLNDAAYPHHHSQHNHQVEDIGNHASRTILSFKYDEYSKQEYRCRRSSEQADEEHVVRYEVQRDKTARSQSQTGGKSTDYILCVKPDLDTQTLLAKSLTMIMLNYTTSVGVMLTLWVIWAFLTKGWMVRIVLMIIVMIYLPSYRDGAEFKAAKRRKRNSLRSSWSFWYTALAWNQMEFVRTEKLEPNTKYLFAIYPHGVGALSRFFFTSPYFGLLFPGVKAPLQLATSLLMAIPLARELSLALGYIDASRPSANYALEHGENVSVYPGGVAEALYEGFSNGSSTTIIRRDGFIRLALEQGAHIVPVAVIGESKTFECIQLPKHWVQSMYRTFKIPLQIALGYMYSFIPKPTPMAVVFGSPIQVPRVQNPSQQQIKQFSDIYFKQLEELMASHTRLYNISSDLCIISSQSKERQ